MIKGLKAGDYLVAVKSAILIKKGITCSITEGEKYKVVSINRRKKIIFIEVNDKYEEFIFDHLKSSHYLYAFDTINGVRKTKINSFL